MAKRMEHDYGGVLAGLVLETATADNLTAEKRMLEAVGAALGGLLGSRIPDQLEPPVGFGHWGPAHSVACGGGSSALVLKAFLNVRGDLRQLGSELIQFSRWEDIGLLLGLVSALGGMLMYVAAGAVVGLPAGYLSHLALDQLRCKSNLPILPALN